MPEIELAPRVARRCKGSELPERGRVIASFVGALASLRNRQQRYTGNTVRPLRTLRWPFAGIGIPPPKATPTRKMRWGISAAWGLGCAQTIGRSLHPGNDLADRAAHLDILPELPYHPPRVSTREDDERIELLQGTLDLLILRTLAPGPAHGHAIAKTIERHSEDVLQVEQGSLYPALHRLIKRRWISAEEGVSENNRRAKFYRLTPAGRRQLHVATTRWQKLARAIGNILNLAGESSS